MVDVFINDQGPYTFLLDTGSGYVSISQRLADEINLPKIWWMDTMAVTGSGKHVKCDVTHIEKLQIGSGEFGEFKASLRGCLRQAWQANLAQDQRLYGPPIGLPISL